MDCLEVPLDKVQITDAFWLEYQRLVKEEVVPYQWLALNDQVAEAEPSHAIENFRIAAGQSGGEFYGMLFQDSDVAKWLEAVAYLLVKKPDATLEETADQVIELVAAVQQPDGYLNIYFTVKAPELRWSNLAECHELYCAGHLIEAGVAYAQATGKNRLPDWCASPQVLVNGEPQELRDQMQRGYVRLTRHWQNGDVLQHTLPMPVTRVWVNEG
ncbi:MAG: beta-L-arabinofuranosidase domain-containing protein [Ewingella sp.]